METAAKAVIPFNREDMDAAYLTRHQQVIRPVLQFSYTSS